MLHKIIEMELTYKTIQNAEGFEAFRALLKASNLPADDLDYKRDLLVGYYEGEALVGTGGLVGTTITEYLLKEAKEKKLKAIYLLTETAKGFFEKKGFKEIKREDVPSEVKASSEFSSVCPVSATVMVLAV
jgi:amino-acid N-acetyltransferase